MKDIHRKVSLGIFVGMSVFVLIFFPAVLILLSGNPAWVEGWILAIWFDGMMLTNMVYLYIKDPGLFAERLNAGGSRNQQKVGQAPPPVAVRPGGHLVGVHAGRCANPWFVAAFPPAH